MNSTPRYATTLPFVSTALLVAAISPTTHAGETRSGLIPAPALDRWMYPFNSTPGTKPTISTFGSTPGAPEFDSRDGQMLVSFDVDEQIPSGLGASRYQIQSLRVTVQFANDQVVAYDPTIDPWQCFIDPADPEWIADSDAGQPIELFGVGYRNGFSAVTFAENSPFTVPPNSPLAPGVRNAFAMSFDAGGAPIDISNHPRERFDPQAWAVGEIDGLEPGSLIPIDSLMHFDIDVSDPAIQAHLRLGVDAGRLDFAISSLTFVVQQGGNFPTFYSKENAFVVLGFASAASLDYTVDILPLCDAADFNCDGAVDGDDLGTLLGFWGPCPAPCAADLNEDGAVDGDDLGSLLGAWTN
ncbi:MAG: hypothetical protein FJ253_02190 [Phycisphaerae bacterium]|nr:hypothetical protein [Phycisphaerae bacterium]